MDEKLYQNIDAPSVNPLKPEEPIDNPENNSSGSKNLFDTIKKMPPKIIALTILGIIIIFLLIISLIAVSLRSRSSLMKRKNPATSAPQPTYVQTPQNVPTIYLPALNEVDKHLNNKSDIPELNIDTEIGL
ncbi:MAG TPA: hypothetical protein VF828_01955 [Patescibacteria group bacterium]